MAYSAATSPVSLTSLGSKVCVFSEPHQLFTTLKLYLLLPPLVFDYHKGDEIATKHKEAIRQLYGFAKVPIERLITQYKLGKSTIIKILEYDAPERTRISRTSRPSLLT